MQQDIMKQWSERDTVPTLRASRPDTFVRRLLAKLPTLLTLREFFAFVLKILAMGALLLIAAVLAAHFANRYIAN